MINYLNEREINKLFDNISVAFFILDKDFHFLYTNKTAKKILGRRNNQLVGRKFWDKFAGKVFYTNLLNAFLTKEPCSFEEFHSPSNKWFKVDVCPSRKGLNIYMNDLSKTKSRDIEIDFLKNELLYSNLVIDTLFDNAPIAMALWNNDLQYIRVNKLLAEINGIEADMHIGKTVPELLPLVSDEVSFALQKVIDTKESIYNQEVFGETPAYPGITRCWRVSYYPIMFRDNVSAIGAICDEITDEKRRKSEFSELMTQLREERDISQEREDRFRQLADLIPHLIWITNKRGLPIFYNQRLYTFTGVDEYMVKNLNWKRLIHPDEYPDYVQNWNETLQTEKPYQGEYRFYENRSKKYKWFLVKAMAVKDKKGKIINWFCTATNIDIQKLVEEKKDEFFNIASHELKTPLTTIKGYAQILARKLEVNPDKKIKLYINKTNLHINKMNNLISDMLDISRIKTGKLVLVNEEYKFDEMIQNVIDNFGEFVRTHKVIVNRKLNISLRGDKERTEQALNNLISNAIKYSPDSSKVELDVHDNKDHVLIAVKDYGIGISKENQIDLFNYLYRVESIEHKFSGLGIGLYIASEIIIKQGGHIWVDSQEGEGSVFYFTLPTNNNV